MSRTRTCRICKGPVSPREANSAFPLCGERCRLLDLGRWLDERYVISGPVTEAAALEVAPLPEDGEPPE